MSTEEQPHVLVLKRSFPAPIETVFRAWTDPDELLNWIGYDDAVAEVDLRVGGRFRIGGRHRESGERQVTVGSFVEIDPPRRLVYTWTTEQLLKHAPLLNTRVTVEFTECDGSTEIVLVHERLPSTDVQESVREGWEKLLAALESHIH